MIKQVSITTAQLRTIQHLTYGTSEGLKRTTKSGTCHFEAETTLTTLADLHRTCAFPSSVLPSSIRPLYFAVAPSYFISPKDLNFNRFECCMLMVTMDSLILRTFLSGATGFVGGIILSSLHKTHLEIHIKALIRRQEDARELQSIYPDLEPRIGNLSSLIL